MYESPNSTRRPMAPPAQIDLVSLMTGMFKILKRVWAWLILLLMMVTSAFVTYRTYTFTPQYRAYVTYAVSKNSGKSEDDLTLASRINNSFRYLLWSGGIYEDIYSMLGVNTKDALPVTFTSSNVADTNFVTITAVGANASQAVAAIDLIEKRFVDLVTPVAGHAQFSVVDQSGNMGVESNEESIYRIFAIGILLGFVVDCGVLFLMAYTSDAVQSYEDLKRHMKVAQVGSLPMIRIKKRKNFKGSLMTLENDRIPAEFREAIYQLRARIEKVMHNESLTTLLVSSSVPGEGKTTVSVNLALAMAERGDKILLIDGDLRSPAVANTLNQTEVPYGILDVFEKKADLTQAVIHLGEKKPDLLAGNRSIRETGKYLASPEMKHLIEEAAKKYDRIIIDTPPSAILTDASVLASYADAITYVVRQNYTRVRSIEEGIDMLGNSNVEMLGCIFNCVELGIGRYGKYGYGSRSSRNRSYYGYGNTPED